MVILVSVVIIKSGLKQPTEILHARKKCFCFPFSACHDTDPSACLNSDLKNDPDDTGRAEFTMTFNITAPNSCNENDRWIL